MYDVLTNNTNLNNGKIIVLSKELETIGRYSFYNSSIEIIEFEANSRIEHIGNSAFHFSRIENIIIPSSVTSIGNYVFNTTNLSKLSFENLNGWKMYDTSEYTNGTSMNVNDPEENAIMFKNTYLNKYWKRN